MAQILAIDIGSTQIKTLTAQLIDSKLELTGAGIARASGIKKGTVTNMDLASKAIKQSLLNAQRQSGVSQSRAVISVSGAHAKSVDSHGIINIPTKEITEKEVNRVMRTALYNASILPDYEILHALPFNFKIDDQNYIQDPVGMSGSRLEVSVHIIIIQKSTLENLKRTVAAAGVEIENIVLTGYASSICVADEDAKELGVCVIDMGGGTCNMVVHQGNSIRYSDYLGVGGSHITGDLSMALHTPLESAEKIKIEHGSLLSTTKEENTISVPRTDKEEKQDVSLDVVSDVMYARVQETLLILKQKLEESEFKDKLGAGLILTGGMTKIEGFKEMASGIFEKLLVRVSSPSIEGLVLDALKDQTYSTAFGLIKYAAGSYTLYEIDSNKNLKSRFNPNAPKTQEKEAQLLDVASMEKTKKKEIPIRSDIKTESKLKIFFERIYRSATELF